MGKNAWRIFQRWVKKPSMSRKKMKEEMETDNFASKNAEVGQKDPLKMQVPMIDYTNQSSVFNIVLNALAKKSYKQKSDHFKRLVSRENQLLAFYSALD